MRYLPQAILLLLLAASAVAGVNEDLSTPAPPVEPGPAGPTWGGPDAVVLWDNGPLITGDCPGNAPPGAESAIAEGRTYYGYAHHVSYGARVADDFTVPGGVEWAIQAITFFAYQTGAGAVRPSTINHVNLRVWDGEPSRPGSSIICGDTSTNLLVSTAWANIYRTNSNCANNRAVMADVVEIPGDCPSCPGLPGTLRLVAGTYWFDWQSDGARDVTGPWVAPITPPGAGQPPNNTMNAVQFLENTWRSLPQADDLPFIIEGDYCAVTPVEAGTWGAIKSLYR